MGLEISYLPDKQPAKPTTKKAPEALAEERLVIIAEAILRESCPSENNYFIDQKSRRMMGVAVVEGVEGPELRVHLNLRTTLRDKDSYWFYSLKSGAFLRSSAQFQYGKWTHTLDPPDPALGDSILYEIKAKKNRSCPVVSE